MRSLGGLSLPRACVAPLGAGLAPLPRWPPLCKMGAFSLPQGALFWRLLATTFCPDRAEEKGF